MKLRIGCDCDEQDDRGENFDSKFQNKRYFANSLFDV